MNNSKITFVMVCALTIGNLSVYGNGIINVTGTTGFSGGWGIYEVGSGSFSGTGGTPNHLSVSPGYHLRAEGALSPFGMYLFAAPPYPENGHVDLHGFVSTNFQAAGGNLFVDLSGSAYLSLHGHDNFQITLTDTTSGIVLLHEFHNAPDGFDDLANSYAFQVTPYHTFQLIMMGNLNVVGIDNTVKIDAEVSVRSTPVPESGMTLGLAGLAVLAFVFIRRLM